jgi:hypothetical protein
VDGERRAGFYKRVKGGRRVADPVIDRRRWNTTRRPGRSWGRLPPPSPSPMRASASQNCSKGTDRVGDFLPDAGTTLDYQDGDAGDCIRRTTWTA